ncbi:kinase-like domain-containing protein [Russula vinacea]|nr:kinase-like domain-containing protein [Russula vinacea]
MLHTDHRRPLPPLSTGPAPLNPMRSPPSVGSVAVKRISLTSKKNWWMVELDDEENTLNAAQLAEPVLNNYGSASELFKCIVKKPEIVQLEINDEMQSNALDVTAQFLAELRVYTRVAPHRNIPAFLGCLDGVGMVLEFLEGGTLYDYLKQYAPLQRIRLCDFHNQLLDALTHLHAHGLSHGDLSLLNVQVMERFGELTLKMIDFGRSVSASSVLAPPDGDPVDPWVHLNTDPTEPRKEQIFRILRGECHDAQLADAYSFGMVLVCLERGHLVDVKPWNQRKDLHPDDLLDGCMLFGGRIREYLRRWDERRRLSRDDMIDITNA